MPEIPPVPGNEPRPTAPTAPDGSAAPDGDPLSPPGLTWKNVSPSLTKVRVVGEALWTGIPALICLVLALTATAYLWIGVAFFVVLFVWLLWLIPRQVRAIGYAERNEDLLIKRGILFRRLVVVPYGRMQYVDIAAGPIARKVGIADVKLHTASAATDASIPGLPAAEAARLREQLASRGEARLAGL